MENGRSGYKNLVIYGKYHAKVGLYLFLDTPGVRDANLPGVNYTLRVHQQKNQTSNKFQYHHDKHKNIRYLYVPLCSSGWFL